MDLRFGFKCSVSLAKKSCSRYRVTERYLYGCDPQIHQNKPVQERPQGPAASFGPALFKKTSSFKQCFSMHFDRIFPDFGPPKNTTGVNPEARRKRVTEDRGECGGLAADDGSQVKTAAG